MFGKVGIRANKRGDFAGQGRLDLIAFDGKGVTLHAQQARGVPYFIGNGLSALDLYWASFANMLKPLPPEVCPMPAYMRVPYTDIGPVIAAALDPVLIEHRDRMFREHIGLPLDFLSDPAP